MPVTGGPYLTCAFFCERVLKEHDGVLSIIRIVDRWNIAGPTPLLGPTIIQATFVLTFKAGFYRGQAQLTVTPITPSNKRLEPIMVSLLFEDPEEKGVGVVQPIAFPVEEVGAYWFEVAIAKQGGLPPEIATCVPMRIAYLQIAGSTPANPS